jgi:hypothetical protein
MLKSTKKRLVLGIAALAVLGTGLVPESATADPKQLNAFVGVGSDTVQDIMNAFSGSTNGANFTPIQSSVATGQKQLISFDAIPPAGAADNCITPKVGGPTFTRPNGSGQGRHALSRQIDGGLYGTAACGGLTDVSGLIDYSRSSGGPGAAGTALTFVPFGRDGVSFAYYRRGGTAGGITTFTAAQLTALYTTGPQGFINNAGVAGASCTPGTANCQRVVPCGIQSGSGTFTFWNGALGVAASEVAATTLCNGLVVNTLGGRAEENDAGALKARGDLIPVGDEVVIGFSAASFIAKSNGVALSNPTPQAADVSIGSISDAGGLPTTGTAPNLTPSAGFFNGTTFGRPVYTVWPTATLTGLVPNAAAVSLVVGSTSALCTAASTIQLFGFLSIGAGCGTTTLQGGLEAGQL